MSEAEIPETTLPVITEGSDGEQLVSFDDACVVADRCDYTIRKWIREGRVRKYKRGATTFIPLADLAPQPIKKPKRRRR